MGYTRYNVKRKKNNIVFSVLSFAIILGILIMLGLWLSKSAGTSKVNNTKETNSKKNVSLNEKSISFICIQLGKYEVSDNADNAFNESKKYGTPFKIKEDNNTRILLGIYGIEAGNSKISYLEKNNMVSSKISYKISKDNLVDSEIAESVSAVITILNKLDDSSVKSINTKDLKKWCTGLQKIDSKSAKLNSIKDFIKSMPDSITKNDAEKSYSFLYEFMKDYIVK